jgi:hypothetical protein
MFTRISYIVNPRKLRTIVEEFILKLGIVFVVPRVLPQMILVPYPVLDMPRGKRCDDGVTPARVLFETFVGRNDYFVPIFSCRRETEIYVLDGPSPIDVRHWRWKNS